MSDISGNNCNCAEAEANWQAAIDLAQQVATLTAERDAALQLAGERAFAKVMEIYGDAQRAEQVGHAARGPLTRGDKP